MFESYDFALQVHVFFEMVLSFVFRLCEAVNQLPDRKVSVVARVDYVEVVVGLAKAVFGL